MASITSTLRYLRLKIYISLIRLVVRLSAPRIRTDPDAVLRIPSRDAGRSITAHVYNPGAKSPSSGFTASDDIPQPPLPVLLNFYGSAFALPLFGVDEGYCRFVAQRTGHVVLDVEYRLAPEAPFPGPNHDVEDAVRYVLSQPKLYDASRVSVSGFSAGGTLALVAPMLFPPDTFKNVVAFYPSPDLAKEPADRRPPVEAPEGTHNGRGPIAWTRLFREAYLGDMDPRDPRMSPVFADGTTLSKYPENLLVLTGEYDNSALDAEKFAHMVEEIPGKRVVLKRMPKCIHGYDKKPDFKDARDESYELVIDILLRK